MKLKKILLVTATKREILPFIKYSKAKLVSAEPELYCSKIKNNNCFILITGVGMINTCLSLTLLLSKQKFSYAINVGIAGSFTKKFKIGEVVNVVKDTFSEIGVEDDTIFVPFYNINKLFSKGDIILENKINRQLIFLNLKKLRKVNAITVNTVHGNIKSIKKVRKVFNPDIETMEGAAFMLVCRKFNIPFLQLKSISNYVEKRNILKWRVNIAINRLNYEIKNLFM